MNSLRFRLILSHILPVLVVFPVVAGLLLFLLQDQLKAADYTGELTRQAVLVADVAGAYSEIWVDTEKAEAFITHVGPRLQGRIMLLNPEGRLIVSSQPGDIGLIGTVLLQPSSLQQASPSNQATQTANQTDRVVIPVITTGGSLLGYVGMENPAAEIYQRALALREVVFGVLGIGFLLSLILGWILANSLAKQLSSVTVAVNRLAEGEKLKPLDLKGPRETRRLFEAVNILVERNQSVEESRRQMLASLVHELGRPLGALISATQALRSGADRDEQLRIDLIAGIDGELRRLRRLLDDLAGLYGRLVGSPELKPAFIDLNSWLPPVLAPWKQEAAGKSITMETDLPDQSEEINVDADRLAQALGNVLSNAISYTPAGGNVHFSAKRMNGLMRFSIQDSGPGIREEEKEKIFEPFYRGEAASRFSDGMGVGLTIARDIVRAHGGDIIITNCKDTGACVTLEIPALS